MYREGLGARGDEPSSLKPSTINSGTPSSKRSIIGTGGSLPVGPDLSGGWGRNFAIRRTPYRTQACPTVVRPCCGVPSVRIGRPMIKCELTITSLTSVFRSDPPSQDQSELRRVSLAGSKYVKTPGIVSAHTKRRPPGSSLVVSWRHERTPRLDVGFDRPSGKDFDRGTNRLRTTRSPSCPVWSEPISSEMDYSIFARYCHPIRQRYVTSEQTNIP